MQQPRGNARLFFCLAWKLRCRCMARKYVARRRCCAAPDRVFTHSRRSIRPQFMARGRAMGYTNGRIFVRQKEPRRGVFMLRIRTLCLGAAASAFLATGAFANPFDAPSTLPLQAPMFDKIKDTDYQPAFEKGMKEQIAEID